MLAGTAGLQLIQQLQIIKKITTYKLLNSNIQTKYIATYFIHTHHTASFAIALCLLGKYSFNFVSMKGLKCAAQG